MQGQSYNFNIRTRNLGNADFTGTLIMTDTIPAGLTVDSIALNGFTCDQAAPFVGPQVVVCSRDYTTGSELDSGSYTPYVTFGTTVTATGSITNQMVVSSTGANFADPNLANNVISFGVTSATATNSANIEVIKTATLATLPSGDVQTFQLEIVNHGPSDASTVRMTDNFLTLIDDDEGPNDGFISAVVSNVGNAPGFDSADCINTDSGGRSRLLTCNIPTLQQCTAGVDCPIVTVMVRPGGNAGPRTNNVQAYSLVTPDPILGDNTDSANFTITAVTDVTVFKSATPDPVASGQNLTYVVTARNVGWGLSRADNVTITDVLPAGLTFVSASPSAGSCSTVPASGSVTLSGSNNQVICNLGNLNVGSQRTVTIVVRPNFATFGTTINNVVDVTTSTVETDATNNHAEVAVGVSAPDLDILVNKVDTIDPVIIGEDTEYVITVSNAGPSAGHNIVVTDTLPVSRLSYQSFTVPSGNGTCATTPAVDSLGGTLICQFPYLASGASEEIRVTMEAVAKGSIINSVAISSDEIAAGMGFDRFAANNLTTENTTIRTRTDIEVVSKTPDSPVVNINDDFIFTVLVRVNTGPGLDEADDVEVSDTLPANMILAGTPSVTVTSGSASITTCTGSAGATSFTCDLGTVSSGGTVEISVPVEVITVTALPQSFNNTASVTTSSLDITPGNNSATGTVSINSSSLAGTVFRDFADDSDITAGDTGIGGTTMTLTGISFDGRAVSMTTTTLPDGTYRFNYIPQGTYSVTRGSVTEPHLTQGTNSVGIAPTVPSGTLSGNDAIITIALPSNTAAVEYDFAFIPQARVGISKEVVGTPTINADGSFVTDFRLTVENLSLENFDDVDVTDALQGAAPLFGTHVTLGTPATDAMTFGTYTMTSAPAGSCGGNVGGFNGAGSQTVAQNFTLSSGDSCNIIFSLRIMPTDPIPPVLASGGRYENQAVVEARGALSGQTSATNPNLTDLSDDGANPDPDGDGDASEAGEDDPTPVAPAYDPQIALVKVADRAALSDPVVMNDVMTYTFEVTNTGNVTLTNIIVADPLPGLIMTGGPIPSLAPSMSDMLTYSATYSLSQVDVDAGFVINQATVTGDDPFDDPVTDLSGATVGDDTPLTTPFVDEPSIVIIKTADASTFGSPAMPDDLISYTFRIINTGNVTLTNVTVTDILPGIVLTGGPIIAMAPGAVDDTTYTATYEITQTDIVAGEVINHATVTGTPPIGPDVTDDSGADATSDDPTVVPIMQVPEITLLKEVDASTLLDGADVGEILNYSFTVTNTGNMPLTDINITDPLVGLLLAGGPIDLLPTESDSTTFTATYAVTLDDIVTGQVDNTATVTGEWTPGETVSAESSVTASVGTIEAIPEVFPPFTDDGGTTTSMLASDLLNGDPATLDNVVITVITADPGVTLDTTTGLITLDPGYPAGTYQVEYQIASVLIPGLVDTTIETVVQGPRPEIETVKTQVFVDNGDGRDDVDDVVIYTIDVTNTGNMPLSDVSLVDTLTDLNGGALTLDSGPTFVSASEGSGEGDLLIGEVATYTAQFTINLQAVNARGIENTVTATATAVYGAGVPPGPTEVTDTSDDGNDSDGNTEDDPTQLLLSAAVPSNGLTITKVTPRDVVRRGELVPYTITLSNDNPFVSVVDIVDTLPNGFLYVDGTAMIGGVSATITMNGGRVVWSDVNVPARGEIVATLSARILNGADAGRHTNSVVALDGTTGEIVAGAATATVQILPEAVFDCGEVVGRVFTDLDGDGYQDAPTGDDVPLLPSGITDQSYDAGKGDPAPEAPRNEVGIPNVRLATVDGLIITTDENGLFSVPCAMLPADGGSNFILKLDDRSLPAGYRMTTENPRIARLTPGMLTEMNFGATIGSVVRVDLVGTAFYADASGAAQMQAALTSGIEQMLAAIGDEPTNVRLAFHVPANATSEMVTQARGLMDMVEDHIDNRWGEIGGRTLRIEQTIVRGDR